ncbi:uncharacterized protein PpBr36_10776 [Pyricularia pennisetigena]|uniref:uncharacterized protein n=1 Tax=Pyricularia pennisetigena TaxID=1578925 RepID=UPI0011539900|nr:uncharacterized protein PpBr36_10776 [Pyricularia pennisetigena]TLS20901.1 hypothetical protein PpBr36_10776 [Pyricularia pennisetigena]
MAPEKKQTGLGEPALEAHITPPDGKLEDSTTESNGKEANETLKSDSPRPVHGVKWVLVVVSLLASFLIYSLDVTIVATIQPTIVLTFGHVDLVPWLAAAFALASAATVLPWSKAYGTFSAKILFVSGTVLSMAASALCGAAPDINAFIVGRALAGVGGIDTVDETSPDAKIYGCYSQAGFPVAQVSVAADDIPYGVGFMMVSQMLGIALGTGMAGALFISSAASGASSALLNAADPDTRARAVHVIALAIRNPFVPMVVSGAIAFLYQSLPQAGEGFCSTDDGWFRREEQVVTCIFSVPS